MLRYPRGKRLPLRSDLFDLDLPVEQNFGGPLGTLIAGVGMCAFYLALIWINMLLGMFLTPLFLIPLTWIQDAFNARKQRA